MRVPPFIKNILIVPDEAAVPPMVASLRSMGMTRPDILSAAKKAIHAGPDHRAHELTTFYATERSIRLTKVNYHT
jgi:hypothetical protein